MGQGQDDYILTRLWWIKPRLLILRLLELFAFVWLLELELELEWRV